MSVYPRSLDWKAPHPSRTTWTCSFHGDLPDGESECEQCDQPSLLARALGEARVSERWVLTFEIEAEPTTETSVGEMAAAALEAMLRVLVNDYDLWPDKWRVERVS